MVCKPYVPLLVISVLGAAVASAQPGKDLFNMNCMACHQLENKNQPIVGPSLVEINHLYGNKPKEFLEWCKEPGKKRKDAIQMPSMAHVAEADLLAIHKYIQEATKGKKFVPDKKVKVDPYKVTGDAAKQPRLQRIFMKDSSPASMAVTLDGQHSLCWDAVSCRLRYVWTGGFIDGYDYWKGNGKALAAPVGKIYYSAPGPELVSGLQLDGVSGAPSFGGYEMTGGLPTYHYELGGAKVSEEISNKEGKLSIRIRVQGADGGARYALGDLEKTELSYSAGTVDNGSLVLNKEQVADFTLTFSPKK